MKRVLASLIAVLLGLHIPQSSFAWDISVPDDSDTLVRTYFNPVFGPFDQFTLPKNDKKSWDIQNFGVFFLNVYCSNQKYFVLTKYQKWSDQESTWKTIAFPKTANLSIKFGKGKSISWGVRLEENVDGIVLSNPNLFVKKIASVSTIEYPIRIESKSYKVKFNTAGFSNYLSDLQDAGC
jgi:hypothetical protein